MPSAEAVAGVFDFLDTVGVVRPPQWSDSLAVADAIASWRAVLFDLSDQALRNAAIAYVRGSRGRFWPSPGELLVFAGPMPNLSDPTRSDGSKIASVTYPFAALCSTTLDGSASPGVATSVSEPKPNCI